MIVRLRHGFELGYGHTVHQTDGPIQRILTEDDGDKYVGPLPVIGLPSTITVVLGEAPDIHNASVIWNPARTEIVHDVDRIDVLSSDGTWVELWEMEVPF